MADIFEIVGVNAQVKVHIKGKEKIFTVHDPKYTDKIAVMKELRGLAKHRDDIDDLDMIEQDFSLRKKYVQLYLPDLTDDQILNMGEHSFDTLYQAVTQMASEKFGACVRKIDAEKKDLAITV
jgi:hypothetical protein